MKRILFIKCQNAAPALVVLVILFFTSCNPKTAKDVDNKIPSPISKIHQDSIVKQHLKNGAWKYGLYSKEWQNEIDKGLAKDSTIAFLWQQKAMPLFKQGKYELGMIYLDKAVKYNPQEWLEYRGFMKCIFSKTYRDAIVDFNKCIDDYGDNYVMDHSYSFYIALSKIQLNEFNEAEELLTSEINRQLKESGEDWVHHLDLFYLGISQYEQQKYNEAIETFDKALKLYPQFSDVLYYKGISLGRIGDKQQGKEIIAKAQEYGLQGYTVNEDNVIYERYPYQIRWELR